MDKKNGHKSGQEPTADRVLEWFRRDPAWVAQEQARKAQLEREQAELREAERPLLEELKGAGFNLVDTVWDFVNLTCEYEAAVPILLRHVVLPYPDHIREGIALALAIPAARPGWRTLLALFSAESEGSVKEGLAAAISGSAGPEEIPELIALVRDRSLGRMRLSLVGALARLRTPEALQTLEEMESDPDLVRVIKHLRERPRPRKPREKSS
jgi:HEAT repeat protein